MNYIAATFFFLVLFNPFALAETPVKKFPEVTFDKVTEIFGHNLETNNTRLRMLLLAIAMDHTSPHSPNFGRPIGIPYIVHKGPNYWASQLKADKNSIESLVNNSLLLLFTDNDVPNAELLADKMMDAAAQKGYWPAEYYMAERNLANHLIKDLGAHDVKMNLLDSKQTNIATETIDLFKKCASMGFAPCHYRLGFWLSSSEKGLKQGMMHLRQAINITINDVRYTDIMDDALVLAAKEIVMKGDQAGLDSIIRGKYLRLIQEKVHSLAQQKHEAISE